MPAPKQTVKSSADSSIASASAGTAGTGAAFLPAPMKLPGFTYVSVLLETLSLASASGMTTPSLTVKVFSAKGQLVESAQVRAVSFSSSVVSLLYDPPPPGMFVHVMVDDAR